MEARMLVFLFLAGVGFLSAAMVVTRRNPVHGALYLVVTFFSVAGIYVVLHAEFLAAVQVLVYAGGIMVLFLFVIMLVEVPGSAELPRPRRPHPVAGGVLAALVVGLVAYHVLSARPVRGPETSALIAEGGNLETVAIALFRHYLLPFEVVSLLLLVAMIGAIVLAKPRL